MTPRQRERGLSRLIGTYGAGRVALMVELFTAGESCAYVGSTFGVSRQAAGLWRQLLGADVHTFVPHSDVRAIADEPTPQRIA